MVLPNEFSTNIPNLIDDYEAFFESLDGSFHKGLRLNTLKNDKNRLLNIIGKFQGNVSWYSSGFYLENEQVTKSPLYHAGGYYLQEPSAMLPAAVLPVSSNDFVLDLCAAPGGKTTLLGERLNGSGMLVSNDISHSRCAPLLKNIERHGIKNACVLNEDSQRLKSNFSEFFDKILLDAPCSGEGMFRKDPKAVGSWVQKGPDYYAPIQYKLLADSAEMLKPGGIISYSTCTFNTAENEDIIEDFLSRNNDFEPYPIDHEKLGISKGLNGLDFCGRIWPHRHKGEGHFLALLKKKGSSAENKITGGLNANSKNTAVSAVEDFLGENIKSSFSGKISVFNNSVMAIPPDLPELKGIRVFRSGLSLGSIKNNRFEPAQALAMALKKEEVNNFIDLEIDDLNVKKYLRGESLEISKPKGWYLICVSSLPLGWAKSDGARLKNKLSGGWIVNG
ncbi:RsmF rRNA methyltransferase first C-terminal domain-containing protein [Tyzzerella sp. OttesenSCG-928-J15]|nr:RsmF rRNA methyltransferase first C-terminal domain-containing protein [Tyzzerella sp. OttesenSCG-928-J15]